MKFKFEPDLQHQAAAIGAMVDLFAGQEEKQSLFTIAPKQVEGELEYNEKLLGYANRCDLLPEQILENLHVVQDRNALDSSPTLEVKGDKRSGEGDYGMDFTVEMETGTGKTYVYLRTIFELNRRYGFTKFVIVVPSVAIREGVKKTIEQTRDHFRQLYDGVPFESFVYDSSDLSRIINFASSSSIRVMIATVQSLGSKAAVFQQAREQTRDIPGVEWVKSTRPILIVDEPQSTGRTADSAGRKIMRAMEPLATIGYSATHEFDFHPIYRLDAFDAHERGLVKSIEVDGARIQDAENSPYLKLIEVETKNGQLPRARVEITKQQAGSVSRKSTWVYDGDVLSDSHISGGRSIYNDYRVGIIQKMGRSAGTMQLMVPGHGVETLNIGDSWGDVDTRSLARAMIRQTIEHHFKKELRNRPLGIKTLSLFFVEAVKDYREYDEAGNASPGPLATVFEEEYAKLAALPRFQSLFADVPADAAKAHGGYFSQDKRSVTPFEEKSFAKSTKEELVETHTFDLIMKDKERLLDEAEPLRFLFSHSALREGWDNPNVFQICSLREMASETRRRQSIGRGLRLCVDNEGQRRRDEGLNVLTVVAQESYSEYADRLQKEMEKELRVKLGLVTVELFAGLTYPLPDGKTGTLKVNESRAILDRLLDAGLIEENGKAKDELRIALATNSVPLPDDLPEDARKLVRERLTRIARKLPIRDARAKGQVKLNLAVLEGHDFQELWKRISRKTTYRLDFDDAALVARCAKAMADMPRPGEARVTFELADMLIGREGVTGEKRSISAPQRLATAKLDLPDLLGELQNRTELPRKVIADILVQSGRLEDATINPSAFVDAAVAIVQAGKRLMMTDGIVYKPLDEWWAQDLFHEEDEVPLERLVKVSKAPLDHIVTDSRTVEAPLAEALNMSGAIKVFAKLPKDFKITTPLGTYNPDWAIVREHDEGEDVYLVSESKGDLNTLREAEKAQIACGKAHFRSLDVPFVTATNLDGILAQA